MMTHRDAQGRSPADLSVNVSRVPASAIATIASLEARFAHDEATRQRCRRRSAPGRSSAGWPSARSPPARPRRRSCDFRIPATSPRSPAGRVRPPLTIRATQPRSSLGRSPTCRGRVSLRPWPGRWPRTSPLSSTLHRPVSRRWSPSAQRQIRQRSRQNRADGDRSVPTGARAAHRQPAADAPARTVRVAAARRGDATRMQDLQRVRESVELQAAQASTLLVVQPPTPNHPSSQQWVIGVLLGALVGGSAVVVVLLADDGVRGADRWCSTLTEGVDGLLLPAVDLDMPAGMPGATNEARLARTLYAQCPSAGSFSGDPRHRRIALVRKFRCRVAARARGRRGSVHVCHDACRRRRCHRRLDAVTRCDRCCHRHRARRRDSRSTPWHGFGAALGDSVQRRTDGGGVHLPSLARCTIQQT